MKIGIVLGTRPEVIKLSPIIRKCEKDKLDYFILHTNQHYSENMDKIFFEELELPQPKYNLGIGSGTHGAMTGRMIVEIEKVLEDENPDVILVQGDTNTVLAGALAASKMDIKVGHVEGGLRSYDRRMPEEINRVVADHVSDYIFAPTNTQKMIVLDESISGEKVHVVGNTIVDAVLQTVEISKRKSNIVKKLNLDEDGFILMTLHRPATVDNKENLKTVINSAGELADRNSMQIVFPAHPRTVKMLAKYGVELPKAYSVIEPVGYLDMISLMQNAGFIVTDSGGLQEESCILQKKCSVTRENTERPEAVEVGGCVLVGNSDRDEVISKSEDLLKKEVNWYNPFGDGTAARQIVDILLNDKET